MMTTKPGRFLTAEWRYLLMLNFEIDAKILLPFVPRGTGLHTFNGHTFVSIVGFRFQRTKLLGIPIPFHRNFDEINLRFYVGRQERDEFRRGVVFIKEIVPRWMVSCVARSVYNENYVTRRMRSQIEAPGPDSIGRIAYEWKLEGRWNRLAASVRGEPIVAEPGSEEEFITEHYWGYTRQRDGGTAEYQVEHPRWRVWTAENVEFDCEVKSEYGPDFALALAKKPTSAFVAEGSAIVVRKGRRIE
jgi:uncharacterized protein YqjF (DUF2071 family)